MEAKIHDSLLNRMCCFFLCSYQSILFLFPLPISSEVFLNDLYHQSHDFKKKKKKTFLFERKASCFWSAPKWPQLPGLSHPKVRSTELIEVFHMDCRDPRTWAT